MRRRAAPCQFASQAAVERRAQASDGGWRGMSAAR
uniref:Uncharacterized protein n=1 Tax=Arundo donax TaxID=35708 RepID=A0A0A9GZC8_ARUDO